MALRRQYGAGCRPTAGNSGHMVVPPPERPLRKLPHFPTRR